MFNSLIEKLKNDPKTIVFTEGPDARILEATARIKAEGFMKVILVGNVAEVEAKAKECGFTPVFAEAEGGRHVYFEEAEKVLLLRKMYAAPLDTGAFCDTMPLEFYRTDGMHKMYVCEIVKALVK